MKFAINWKTTVLGISGLISIAAHWYATGITPGATEISALLASLGLIAAKDA